MNALVVILVILLLIIIIPLVMLMRIYNELVKERVLVEESWSGIGTFLQKRLDLIPNLVETVKGYAAHEKDILTEISKWHSRGVSAINADEQQEVAIGLSSALRSVFSIAQNYPDLKADAHFQNLYYTLDEIEDNINSARRYYNGTVREYNQSIAVFPKFFIANAFGFKAKTFFAEQQEAITPPKVNFTGNN